MPQGPMAPLMMTMISDATPAPQASFIQVTRDLFRREFIGRLFDREIYANEKVRYLLVAYMEAVSFGTMESVIAKTMRDMLERYRVTLFHFFN